MGPRAFRPLMLGVPAHKHLQLFAQLGYEIWSHTSMALSSLLVLAWCFSSWYSKHREAIILSYQILFRAHGALAMAVSVWGTTNSLLAAHVFLACWQGPAWRMMGRITFFEVLSSMCQVRRGAANTSVHETGGSELAIYAASERHGGGGSWCALCSVSA